jgi:FkbM family methyltransferase
MSASGLSVRLRDPGQEGYLGDRAAFAHVFFAGEYDFLLDRMAPGDIVLDAGANIGCFTLRASQQVGPRGLVIAVEPEPSNAACLNSNIGLNHLTNVVIVERALSAISDRTVTIIGTGTTASVDEPGNMLPLVDPTAGSSRTSVRTITLNDLLTELSVDRLDIIKMDIEGSENSIFATAATSEVLATARAVAVEVHNDEGPDLVQSRLRAEGYSYVSGVTPESGFFIRTVRRAVRRPDLVLKLYGMEVLGVVARILLGSVRRQPHRAENLLGMVHASR